MVDLNIDLNKIRIVEFGIGRDGGKDQTFLTVPVRKRVQSALQNMVDDTWSEMLKSVQGRPTQTQFEAISRAGSLSAFVPVSNHDVMESRLQGGPMQYEIAEKYAGTEYVYLSSNDDKASVLRNLHEAHLDATTNVFDDLSSIFCYFTRMQDENGSRLTAIKRATTFKALAQKGNLLFMSANELDIMDDNIFKLDNSFDILVDSDYVHIWRANSFEAIGKLREDILMSVPDNIETIKQDINFVDFGPIGLYASQHIMGARYLASIKAQLTTEQINKDSLVKLCNDTGVSVSEKDGMIAVDPMHILGFLEVLDRRRYRIELIDGKLEQFRATSRQRINQ